MALITFQLEHGLKAMGSGDEPLLYREVGLRELTAADLIDAQLDAEKVVVQNGKAVAYTSALFQSAQSTYLEILSAQQSLLSAQLTEVSDNVQRMQAVVSLYSAIGGGRE